VPPFLLVGSGAVLLQAAPWLVVLVALALLGRRPRRAGTVPDHWRAGVTL
jgi:hypothetical protein